VYWVKLSKFRNLFNKKYSDPKDKLISLLDLRQSLPREDITAELNISSEELETLLLQLKKSGEVFEPRQNEIRRVL